MKCVSPHATMNSPNATKTTLNGMSRRARCTSAASANEMTTYDAPISRSDQRCVSRSGRFHR
jgi:hypothetical protein